MANNRLYLCHRPTGKAVFLAKRMAGAWAVRPNVEDALQALFVDAFDETGTSDDFVLCIETGHGAPGCLSEQWRMDAEQRVATGVLQFEIDNTVPIGPDPLF